MNLSLSDGNIQKYDKRIILRKYILIFKVIKYQLVTLIFK